MPPSPHQTLLFGCPFILLLSLLATTIPTTQAQPIVVIAPVGGVAVLNIGEWSLNQVRFLRANTELVASGKYVFGNGSNNNQLMIMNVVKEDFGEYRCQLKPEGIQMKEFNLVVVDPITMTLTPASVLTAGDNITVTCLTTLTVSSSLRLTEDQQPHFYLHVGGVLEDQEKVMGSVEVITGDSRVHQVLFNLTVDPSMAFKNASCRLASNDPPFTLIQNSTLNLAAGPVDIMLPTNNTLYDIGDVITCSAQSHPPSLVIWQPLKIPADCPIRGNQALETVNLTVDCAGPHSWQCIVMYRPSGVAVGSYTYNYIGIYNDGSVNPNTNPNTNVNNINNVNVNTNTANNNNNVNLNTNTNRNTSNNTTTNIPLVVAKGNTLLVNGQMSKTFAFTVNPLYDDANMAEADGLSATDRTILGLVLGLGIPLILIIILIVTCCFCVKKRKEGKNGGMKKTTLAKVMDSKKKQPAGPIKTVTGSKTNSGVSVSAVPNPLAATATLNPPSVIRGSPGIPDIGARHLGGSGSIPQLNDSMDAANITRQQYNNYSEMSKSQQKPSTAINFGAADLGGNKAFTDI